MRIEVTIKYSQMGISNTLIRGILWSSGLGLFGGLALLFGLFGLFEEVEAGLASAVSLLAALH